MKTTIKQTIASIITVALALYIICEAQIVTYAVIDNPSTAFLVSIGLSIWLGGLALWLLAGTIVWLREDTSASRRTIYTDRELATRDRYTTSDLDEQQETLKRKYAIRD